MQIEDWDGSDESLNAIAYESGPSILLFADDPDKRAEIGSAIRAAGGRISVAMELDRAVDRIAAHASPDGVVVELGNAEEGLAAPILDAIEEGARTARFDSIALLQPHQIDLAVARAGHAGIDLLCASREHEFAASLATLVHRRGLMLNDITADAAPVRLRELSEQVGRIARTLEALSGREDAERRLICGGSETDPRHAPVEAPAIRAMIRARRMRDQYFGEEIFADPAWDMLLDLTAARLEGQPVAVSSLCIAAAVPPTTALRWIKAMTEMGLFERVGDPHDRRRIFIELSPRAMEGMLACLQAMRRLTPMGV